MHNPFIQPVLNNLIRPSSAHNVAEAVKEKVIDLKKFTADDWFIIQWDHPETIKRLFPQEKNAGNALLAFTSYLHRDMAIKQNLASYDMPAWVAKKDAGLKAK